VSCVTRGSTYNDCDDINEPNGMGEAMVTEAIAADVATHYALDWLNHLGEVAGSDPLPDDYFTDVTVMFNSHEDEPILLLEMNSSDDGGPARMLCYLRDGQVAWGAWYFDGTWGEMR
jgi:hypothetical protein